MFGNKLYDRKGPFKFANICKDEILSVSNPTNRKDRLLLGKVEVGNSSSADASCGFGYLVPAAQVKAYQSDIDGGTGSAELLTDDTTDFQDAGADDFIIGTDTVDNDGAVIAALEPFNCIGLTVGNAEAGTAGTYAYQYWNGTAWATFVPHTTADFTGTGDTYVIFNEPHDWAPLASGDIEGGDAGYYPIKIKATTAATTTSPDVTIGWVVNLLDYVEKVGDGNSIVFEAQGEYRIPGTAPLVPYCSTADAQNWCLIEYRKGS